MPPVGFEPMISALERAKVVHALDCAATVIRKTSVYIYYIKYSNIPVMRHIWDQGTAALPKTTDYWKKSEQIN
jgi:hypothetical protein